VFPRILIQKRSLYQHRLGTNIGKTQNERRLWAHRRPRSGVVKGVCPAVLAHMLMDIGIKWPEKDRPVKKRKLEVAEVSAVDWQTKVWYEHSAIPVMFVAVSDDSSKTTPRKQRQQFCLCQI
jgi:hypothetical protein